MQNVSPTKYVLRSTCMKKSHVQHVNLRNEGELLSMEVAQHLFTQRSTYSKVLRRFKQRSTYVRDVRVVLRYYPLVLDKKLPILIES